MNVFSSCCSACAENYSIRSTEIDGMPAVVIGGLTQFDISKIFDCGQCFRFDVVENSMFDCEFSGIAFGRFVAFGQTGGELTIINSTPEDFYGLWRHYLGLDIDYDKIRADIISSCENPHIALCAEFGSGIRILAQEPWETVCSFIISQNNNIPRIKKLVESLSAECGTPISLPKGAEKHLSQGKRPYAFPTPNQVMELGVDRLFALKTGFRAKYIYDAAQKFSSGVIDIDSIFEMSTAEACELLCTVKGIGNKVASCALLFGFEKYDAFPVDVWIKRVITNRFEEGFDFRSLGQYAGIAQQYLFYYERYNG